jgi:hypothetical protein
MYSTPRDTQVSLQGNPNSTTCNRSAMQHLTLACKKIKVFRDVMLNCKVNSFPHFEGQQQNSNFSVTA